MRTRFVAEVSSNHARSLERGLRFVDVAAEVGCAAVKFQQFKIDELFAPEALRANPALRRRREWELPEEFNADLARRAHAQGLEYSSTPFYLDAVGVLAPHVDFFKVASYQILWLDLLREVGRARKPVVLATGMATLDEVRGAVDAIVAGGAPELTLLHCVSLYPTLPEEANLAAIDTLRRTFDLPVGWSDHTVSPEVVQRAIGRWEAPLVEFHLDLDGAGEEYVAGHCWLPEEIAAVIAEPPSEQALSSEPQTCDGSGEKRPAAGEDHERRWRTDPSDGLRPLLETRRGLAAEEAA